MVKVKEHIGKIVVGVSTAAIIALGAAINQIYQENAWASDMQEMRQDWKEQRITNLRRELNEIEQKELDGIATKYDLLRKKQLERDYNELLNQRK